MDRPLLVSVSGWDLVEVDPAFLDALADRGVGVELFSETGVMGYVGASLASLDEHGLWPETVHAPPLIHGSAEDGHVDLNTYVAEITLEFDTDGVTGEDAPTRVRRLDPSVITFHPPRFPSHEPVDLNDERERLLLNLAASADYRTGEPWGEHTIALENVCPRGSFEYLLAEPDDVAPLRTVAERTETAAQLAFTVDLGHARDPRAFLAAVGDPATIHLHGTRPAIRGAASELCERYGLDDPSAILEEPSVGELQHLPPAAGTEDLDAIGDVLDALGVACPVVVELARPFMTPNVLDETIAALADAGVASP